MIKYYLNIIFCFLFGGVILAQQLSTKLESSNVQIGEPFTVHYLLESKEEIKGVDFHPQEENFIAWESKGQNLSVTSPLNEEYLLEIVGEFQDTSYWEEDHFVWEGIYHLLAWDSAYVILPPQLVMIQDSIFEFPPTLISVDIPNMDSALPLEDINELFTIPPKTPFSLLEWLKKYGVFIVLLFLLVGIYLYFKKQRKKRESLFNEKILTPQEVALLAIDQLEKGKSYNEDVKEYYYQLSLILRKFLATHFQTALLDKTTMEVKATLEIYSIEREVIDNIIVLLSQSDMVKFAKSKPAINAIIEVTNSARNVVNIVAKINVV